MSTPIILPKLIRLKDISAYLGMDRHFFNKEVRPKMIAIRIGRQGIAFDRLDLDAWVEHTKQCSGRPTASNYGSVETWDERERQVSIKKEKPGKLTKKSSGVDYAKALAQAISKKQRSTSPGVWKG